MTIDQRASRSDGDDVPTLLTALAGVPTVLPFARTIGDEAQGVIDDPGAATMAVLLTAQLRRWHIGIGIGPVDTPLPEMAAEAHGDAFYRARSAVEAAKNAPAHLVVDSGGDTAAGGLAEGALRTLVWTVETMRPESMRYILARLTSPDAPQAAIASQFDVSQQAVSRVLSQGGADIVAAAMRLAETHLREAGDQAMSAAEGAAPHGGGA